MNLKALGVRFDYPSPAIWDRESKALYVIRGTGRCEAATTYVLATSPAAAVAKIKRKDASPYFEVGSVERFAVTKEADDG